MALNDVAFVVHFSRAQSQFAPRHDDIAHSTPGILGAAVEGILWILVAMLSLKQSKTSYTAAADTDKTN
jgi:hypothetical protein